MQDYTPVGTSEPRAKSFVLRATQLKDRNIWALRSTKLGLIAEKWNSWAEAMQSK